MFRDPLGDRTDPWRGPIVTDEAITRRRDDLCGRPVQHHSDTAERLRRIEQAEMQS
jgi:hypothetical protein